MTFEVPDGREGSLRLDARWGNIEASTRITVREGGLTEPQFVGPVSSLAASADGQGDGTVRLIWSPAENAQVHFVIYVKSEELYAGNYASARMAPFSGSEGVITGLDGGTTYHFNVIGIRWNWVEYGAVWGSWTDWASATPVGGGATSDAEPPLTEPQNVGRATNLTASADGQEAGTVRVTWSEADNAQVHFVIYVKSAELYANNYASAQMAPFAGSEGLITGLNGGTSYHFNVIGMRWNWVEYGAVWGGWAEWASAAPLSVPAETIDFTSLPDALLLEREMPQAAADIKALPWVSDGITLPEKDALEPLVSIALDHPDVFNVLIRLPWIVDSITEVETAVIVQLDILAYFYEATAERIIQMPFLEAIDPPDLHAMRYFWVFADKAWFQQILSHFTQSGGIDEDDIKIIALLWSSPSLRSVLLDPDRVEDVEVEERIIQLPLSGDVVLTIIRTQPGNAGSMDLLANAVRSAEAFIDEPFPVNYVALFFGENVLRPGAAGTHFGTHIAVLPRYDAVDGGSAASASHVIAHEVAHYYWRGNKSWVDEGASDFTASIAENERIGAPVEATNPPCAYATNIADLERLTASNRITEVYGCNYSLGERLFLDLYRNLDDSHFRQGLRDLYLSARHANDLHNPQAVSGISAGIEQVRNAFPPEASAVIARWYDGTEPYDLSNLDTRPVDPTLPSISGRIGEAYITLGLDGPVTSSFSSRAVNDWLFLFLEYSYLPSGILEFVPLEIVEFYEDGFEIKRRTVTTAAYSGRRTFVTLVGTPPAKPWAPGRYWVYVYDGDRKVAEVTYTVTP